MISKLLLLLATCSLCNSFIINSAIKYNIDKSVRPRFNTPKLLNSPDPNVLSTNEIIYLIYNRQLKTPYILSYNEFMTYLNVFN